MMTHRLPTQRDEDAWDDQVEACPACLAGETHVHHQQRKKEPR